MKKEVMEKWVAALRSGEYTQGRVYLKNDDSYCCLGVLCEILGAKSTEMYTRVTAFDGQCHGLPESVLDSSGIKTSTGAFDNGGATALTIMNDTGQSFSSIADIIEKHWEEL